MPNGYLPGQTTDADRKRARDEKAEEDGVKRARSANREPSVSNDTSASSAGASASSDDEEFGSMVAELDRELARDDDSAK